MNRLHSTALQTRSSASFTPVWLRLPVTTYALSARVCLQSDTGLIISVLADMQQEEGSSG